MHYRQFTNKSCIQKNIIIISYYIPIFLQVLIALMLFFGHLKTTLDHNEFVSALAGIGVIGAIHMFSWLVVFQFRKNLMEEHRLMARLVASAPLPPGKYLLFSKIFK